MALLAALAAAGLVVWASGALAASAPPTPTLTANPNTSPTNSPTETFTFSSSGATSYQCSMNGAAFTACTSPKTYGSTSSPLAEGSYTFQVQALDNKGHTSSAATYSWVVDRTAPLVSSINRAGASPTNAGSVSWTVTFNEPVRNVGQSDFSLVVGGGLGGSPAITGLTGSGATYSVTASTGSGSGTLGLNLTSKGTISDQAGNPLGGSMPVVGQVYTLDRTPPPAPSITSGPSGTTNQTTASFGFSDSESGVLFQCKLDSGSYAACTSPKTYSGLADGSHIFSVQAVDAAGNVSAAATRTWTVDSTPPPKPSVTGPNNRSDSTAATLTFTDSEAGVSFQCSMDNPTTGWSACTSPKTYYGLTPGAHEFDVRAVDAAGNVGDYNGWKWTINGLSGSGLPFTINNPTLPPLHPGGSTDYLNLSLTNPNSSTIYISSLTVALSIGATPHAGPFPCTTGDFALTQFSDASSTNPIVLGAGQTKTLSQLGFSQSQMPSIKMLDLPHSQDHCQGATLNFTYGGSAQS